MVFLGKIKRLSQNKKVKLATDITILLASSYLMFKKLFDFSLSKWLTANIFQSSFVNMIEYTLGMSLALAILSKIVNLKLEQFPEDDAKNVEPHEISTCLLAMNNEICTHLEKCETEKPVNVRRLNDQHNFSVHICMIIASLAEHIRMCCNGIKLNNKDIFISLYSYDGNNTLKYLCHFDPSRDLVKSKVITINSAEFSNYECVKCMKSSYNTTYLLDKTKYAKGSSKRHKTITQYIGCKIVAANHVCGFLSIEFHNQSIFSTDEQMQYFMENNIFPFKTLLEYQFLKKTFFSTFKSFELYWRLQ